MCELFFEASNEFNAYMTEAVGELFERKVRAVTVEVDYSRAAMEDGVDGSGFKYLERRVKASFDAISS